MKTPAAEEARGEEDLLKQRWTKQLLASGSLLEEACADYAYIGLEVHLERPPTRWIISGETLSISAIINHLISPLANGKTVLIARASRVNQESVRDRKNHFDSPAYKKTSPHHRPKTRRFHNPTSVSLLNKVRSSWHQPPLESNGTLIAQPLFNRSQPVCAKRYA
jgi:hypothetical protein